LTLG